MSGDEGRHPRWRVLVDGDRVAVDATGAIASVAEAVDGFPLAPELLVEVEGLRAVDVRGWSPGTGPEELSWRPLGEGPGPEAVLDAVRSAVATYAGRESLPARRQAWFAEPWRAQADAWVDATLAGLGRRRTGPSVPVKVWSLSAVLRVATDQGPVFLKATCDHFGSEPRITDLLGRLLPGRVPALLGFEPDRGWQLMEPLAGVSDEDDPTPRLAAPAAAAIAAIQLDCVPHVAQLRAAGCPERGLESSLAAFRDVLASSPELRLLHDDQVAAARAALPEIERRLAELAAYDVPATLVHGDLHLGNVAHHDGLLTVFDWSDASVGHPFVDLVTLTRSSPPEEHESSSWRTSAHGGRPCPAPTSTAWWSSRASPSGSSRPSPTSGSRQPRRTRRSGRWRASWRVAWYG